MHSQLSFCLADFSFAFSVLLPIHFRTLPFLHFPYIFIVWTKKIWRLTNLVLNSKKILTHEEFPWVKRFLYLLHVYLVIH